MSLSVKTELFRLFNMLYKNSNKKILVLRYRFIGDTILTVPFMRNLRRAEPDAYIAWVVAPGSSDVIQGIPYVDDLIFWDPITIHADSLGTHKTFSDKLKFITNLRAQHFDKVYVLKRSFGSALMAFFSGAKKRIGFATEGRSFLLTKSVPYRQEQHEVLSFLDILKADNIAVTDDYLEAWSTSQEIEQAEQLITATSDQLQLFAIHPFGSIYQKTWPIERFAETATRLHKQFGVRPIILGAKGDRAGFNKFSHLFPENSIDLVGKCGIRITQAVLSKSSFFLGNDSGVMHLAAAAGIPLLAIFGPTSPARFGPWGEKTHVIYSHFKCSPCRQKYFTECKPSDFARPACITSITVESIVKECSKILGMERLV